MSAGAAVDINNLDLMNEVIEVDGNVDSAEFFNPPLPDDGEHEVIIALGNRGVKADRQWEGDGKGRKRTGSGFLNIHLRKFPVQRLRFLYIACLLKTLSRRRKISKTKGQ